MIYEDFKNIKTDRTIKALIGMSREKFDLLVPHFSSAYQEIQEEQRQNKEIKRLPAGGKKGVFSSHEERLFFVLFYLKTYPTFDVLGFHFGLSAGHAHDYIKFFTRVLDRALSDLEMLPEQEIESPEDMMHLLDKTDDIIIDGVESRCVRPKNEEDQKACYSGKKKCHTVKSLVISDRQRKLLFVSPLFDGSVHDYAMMNSLFDPALPWFDNLTVRLDLGFLGAEKDYGASSNILLPHKKPRKSKKNPCPELTSEQKQTNLRLAKTRIIVEHAIGGMKHFFCLTHRIRNRSVSLINQFFSLAAGLWNMKIA